MTLHPAGKAGVNIDKQKYDTMREAVLQSLQVHGTMTFKELTCGKFVEGWKADSRDRSPGT